MKLLIEGDFTFLKLNTVALAENLPRIGQVCMVIEIDDQTRQLTRFRIHGTEMLPDKPIFLSEVEV